MNLKKVLGRVKVLYADKGKNIDIKDICISTNDVKEGSLFVCLKGQNFDGHNFKQEALEKGAIAFLVEEYDKNFSGLQIIVTSTREALSQISKNFYHPNSKLKVIGITGTNGKTTTTFMLASILKSAGKNVGVIGTEGICYNGKTVVLNMTTPDPIDLFKQLQNMQNEGVEYVVMEVSAHAIFLNKINALDFYAKGFTNITEDHLDFFSSMEEYAKTKIDFINQGECKKVVNILDAYGKNIFDNNKSVYSYGITTSAEVYADNISTDCSDFTLNLFGEQIDITTQIMGKYNVENALCASAIASLIGIDNKSIKDGMEAFESVAGRMNIYSRGDKRAIIDFAHTPDAMAKILSTVKEFTKGKVICVFGCGGNRDPIKRSIMGEIASQNADMVYITNDNPRFEEDISIANMVQSGIKNNNYQIILDRSNAITMAVSEMQDGDTLVICGKGAENYMDIKGVKYPYSDKEEILKLGFKKFKNEKEKTKENTKNIEYNK